MTSYNAGDLVIAEFPFAGSKGTKKRPAVVLLDTGDSDIVLARVTTQLRHTSYDVILTDWRGAGLQAPSVVRLHKIITSEKTQVVRVLGLLQPADRQQVSSVLRLTFGNW